MHQHLDQLVNYMRHLANKHGEPEIGVILHCHRVCPLGSSCMLDGCFYHGPRLSGDYPWPFLGLKRFSLAVLVHEFGHYHAHRQHGWDPYGPRPHDGPLCEQLAKQFAKAEGFDAARPGAEQRLALLGVREIVVWQDKEFCVPWYPWVNEAEIKEGVNVTWDPERTRVTRAELRIRGCLPLLGEDPKKSEVDPGLTIYMNDREVFRHERWGTGDPKCKDATVDVTKLLRNGWNDFRAVVWKLIPGVPVTYCARVTVKLVVWYEGIEPEAETERQIKERWFKAAFWLVTFAALGVVGVTIYKELRKP